MPDPIKKAQVSANVGIMLEANAPQRDIEDYLREEGISVSELPKYTRAYQTTKGRELLEATLEQKYKLPKSVAGAIGSAAETSKDIAGAAYAAFGMIPGAQSAASRVVAALSPSLTYQDVVERAKGAEEDAPAWLRRSGQVVGLGATLPFTPARVLAGGKGVGALFGGGLSAAQRFGEARPEESMGEKLRETGKAGAIGAGLGAVAPWALANPLTRTALGTVGGAITGWNLAPEGQEKIAGGLAGAVAGGAALASPATTLGLIAKGTSKIARPIAEAASAMAEASGTKGAINRSLIGRQNILSSLGLNIPIGSQKGASTIVNAAKEAQSATSAANYSKAIDDEGAQIYNDYQAQRGNVISDNVNRMVNWLRQEATDVGEALSQETSQSVTGAPKAPYKNISEALDAFNERLARVGRRETRRVQQVTMQAGETAPTTAAREALERREAYASLPREVRPVVKMEGPRQLPVPPEVNPLVTPMYQNPVVRDAAAQVRRIDRFRSMAPDDPRFVDEIYKVISDQKLAISKTVASAEVPKNFLRATKAQLQDAHELILNTVDDLMPTYRTAVEQHGNMEQWMKAFRMGMNMATGKTTAKNVLATSPEAFERWAIRQPADIADAARLGARYGYAGEIAGVPFAQGVTGVVERKALQQTPEAAKRRAVTGLKGFEKALGAERVAAATYEAPPVRIWAPGAKGHAAATVVNSLFKSPIQREEALKIYEEVMANPDAYQQVLNKYKAGTEMKQKLSQLFAVNLGAMRERAF